MKKVELPPVDEPRIKRSKIFYFTYFSLFFLTSIFLLLIFSRLLLPVLLGMLFAYLLSPVLMFLKRAGIPKWAGLIIIFSAVSFLILIVGKQLVDLIPNDEEQIALKIQIQYKVNEEFLSITGRDDYRSEGNFIYSIFGDELDPVVHNLLEFLSLDENELTLYQKMLAEGKISDKIKSYFESNKKYPFAVSKTQKAEAKPKSGITALTLPTSDSKIAKFINAVSNWIVLPFVFLFFLIDDGQIKRAFVGLLPNRYFEMSLTIFDSVDSAIGNYLRGTLMQSALVGISFIIGLTVIGFETKAAILIGFVAGIANAIPFLGPALGLGIGLIYALIIEGIRPMIPFLTIDPILGVVIVVAVVQGLDNSIFQPLVLGKAVNLHPLVVLFGVTGGSILFGFTGMLLAIPTIVVIKVVFSTIHKQLKLYYIIY